MREQPAIVLEEVTKTYWNGTDPVHALRGATVRVNWGEMLVLAGPSGCGKTTLLNLMGGLDVPTSGQVWVAGHFLATLGEGDLTVFRRRHVGIVFQFFHLLPTLTVWENVALPLHLDGRHAGEVEARVANLLSRIHLEHRSRQKAFQLSGGEMQRVAVARALANDPEIILADEPTGNLDSRAGREVLDLEDVQRAVLLVDRLLVLSERSSLIADRSEAVFTRPPVKGQILADADHRIRVVEQQGVDGLRNVPFGAERGADVEQRQKVRRIAFFLAEDAERVPQDFLHGDRQLRL